jgi:hypothetical protein
MEDRLWGIVCMVVPGCKLKSGQCYSDRDILLVMLWAALHDRPVCWACDPANWSARRRPAHLPHPSTVSRRARLSEMASFIESVHVELREQLSADSRTAMIDGKPLLVSDYSRDPEAANGRSMRRWGRGYKLHAVVDAHGVVQAFEVLPLNVQERVAARRLLVKLPNSIRRVLADGNYDSGPLHKLLEPLRRKLYTPLIKNYAGPRSHPRRRRLFRIMNHDIGIKIANAREHIERQFALMGNLGFGLKGLPNWVRRQHRVTNWISHKLLLYHAWRLQRDLIA